MRISKVARRARSAAEALKSTGMPHQEVSSTCFYCQSVQPWKQMIYKTHFVFSRQPSRIWVTSSRNCPRSPPSLSLKVLYWNHIPWVLPSILCSPRASDMVFESKPLQECKDFLTAEKAFVEARDHAVQYSRMLCFKYHYPLYLSPSGTGVCEGRPKCWVYQGCSRPSFWAQLGKEVLEWNFHSSNVLGSSSLPSFLSLRIDTHSPTFNLQSRRTCLVNLFHMSH